MTEKPQLTTDIIKRSNTDLTQEKTKNMNGEQMTPQKSNGCSSTPLWIIVIILLAMLALGVWYVFLKPAKTTTEPTPSPLETEMTTPTGETTTPETTPTTTTSPTTTSTPETTPTTTTSPTQ
jgi:cytoskeletal protein RodZ